LSLCDTPSARTCVRSAIVSSAVGSSPQTPTLIGCSIVKEHLLITASPPKPSLRLLRRCVSSSAQKRDYVASISARQVAVLRFVRPADNPPTSFLPPAHFAPDPVRTHRPRFSHHRLGQITDKPSAIRPARLRVPARFETRRLDPVSPFASARLGEPAGPQSVEPPLGPFVTQEKQGF